MNKLDFELTTMCCGYGYHFTATWGDDSIVEYSLIDTIFNRTFEDYEIKGKLDEKQSAKFIEYIKKADIPNMDDNIRINIEKQELQGYKTDQPRYGVSFVENNVVYQSYWDSGYLESTIDQQNYLYFAMMLCDKNAFELIYWLNEGYNDDIPFKGEIKHIFYKTDNDSFTLIKDSICVPINPFIEEFIKINLTNCFKNENKEVNDNDDWWQVILVNEDDEVFNYCGCKGDNPRMDVFNKVFPYVKD